MNYLLTQLLSLLLIYKYPVIILIILLGSCGVPLPVSSVVLAAGAFSAEGLFNMYVLFVVVWLSAIMGDLCGYYVGNRWGERVIKKVLQQVESKQTQLTFMNRLESRFGILFVFFTRWLLTPLCLPINILAGTSHYSLTNFFIGVVLGEFVWAGLYVCLGYVFGANWLEIVAYISNTPLIFALAIVGCLSLFLAMHRKQKNNSQ